MPDPGGFAWWPAGREVVAVLRTASLWGDETADVVVPSTGQVRHLAATDLAPLSQRRWLAPEAALRAASARIVHEVALGNSAALATGRLEPLPHQLAVLRRALDADPVRLLLADEVGLGKTIEAGLIISELKARRQVRRVAIVAPKGVQLQWVSEMADRFGEDFVIVGPGGIPDDAGVNPWRAFNRVVCSLDAVKPIRGRAGWPPERVAEHNERRFRGLVDAGWDLVVIDEAHHVSGSSEEVARHRLGLELSRCCPRVLLLSATPHSGKSESFARLLGLLDERFLHGAVLNRESVGPLVVRTEKRAATDAQGRPLFKPRITRLETVPYGARHIERALYEAVTDYVRHGYQRARAERRQAVGFLVLLMQRLVSSSTAAILDALERRLVAVTADATQMKLFGEGYEDWAELTGEDQVAALSNARGQAWNQERAEVEHLVDVARKAAAGGVDAKAHFLLDLLRRLARNEGDPSLKAVVFTEYVATQDMLLGLLESTAIPAVSINGSMSIPERRVAQELFARDARVLVSTDAGAEGINLQFAHVVVNYDLPWSPMRLEQRIGRVDRIGQSRDVLAFNLALESSVDARVLEVLEEKLRVILAELGADKVGDVLAGSTRAIGDLYTAAIMDPDTLDAQATALQAEARAQVVAGEPLRSLLSGGAPPGRPGMGGDIGRWVRLARAARAALACTDPEADGIPAGMPEMAPGEPLPLVAGPRPGLWSLWEVGTGGPEDPRDCFAIFESESGAIRPDLAEGMWLALSSIEDVRTGRGLDPEAWQRLQQAGADHAFRFLSEFKGRGRTTPWLALRLAVRVET